MFHSSDISESHAEYSWPMIVKQLMANGPYDVQYDIITNKPLKSRAANSAKSSNFAKVIAKPSESEYHEKFRPFSEYLHVAGNGFTHFF